MSHRWSSFGCRLWFKSLFIGILRIGWRFVRWILPSYPYICDAPISEQGELGFSLDNCEYMWLLIVSIYQRRFRSRVSWRSAISVSSISFFGIVRSLTFWHGTGMTTGASIYLRLLKVCSNYLPSSYIWCKVSLWIHDSVIILSYICLCSSLQRRRQYIFEDRRPKDILDRMRSSALALCIWNSQDFQEFSTAALSCAIATDICITFSLMYYLNQINRAGSGLVKNSLRQMLSDNNSHWMHGRLRDVINRLIFYAINVGMITRYPLLDSTGGSATYNCL